MRGAKKKAPEKGGTSNTRRMGGAALMLSAGILASRLLGYLREAVIAYQQGAGVETDAYNAAFLIPDLMNYFLAGGTLSITFIPLFSAMMAKDKEEEGWRLFSTIASIMGLVLLAGILVSEIFTESFIQALFSVFSEQGLERTVEMTRVVLPCQLFHYVGGLMLAVLMAHGRFAAATLAPLVYNGAIILFGLLLGPQLGMTGFAVGALIGSILGPFGLSLFLARDLIRFKPNFDWRSKDFRRYIKLSIPLMIGVSLMTVDEWLGRIFGSDMETGTVSWLNYARRLMLVPIAIIGQAAGQAALPFLSRLAGEGKRDELAKLLTRTLHYVILLAMVAGALTLALSFEVVSLIYQRGAFSVSDASRTATILELFALGIVAWGVQLVTTRAFYAEQNTLTPMILSTVVTLLFIPVYWSLGQAMDARGLALASALGMSAQALTTLTIYARTNPSLSLRPIARSAFLGLTLGAAAWASAKGASLGLASMGLHAKGTFSTLSVLSISGLAGVLAALLIARWLAPEEVKALSTKILRRFQRSTNS